MKTNKFIKTSIILFLIELLYLPPIFIKVKNPDFQAEIDSANILKANLSCWNVSRTLENNIHLIIFLTLLLIIFSFLVVGLIGRKKVSK